MSTSTVLTRLGRIERAIDEIQGEIEAIRDELGEPEQTLTERVFNLLRTNEGADYNAALVVHQLGLPAEKKKVIGNMLNRLAQEQRIEQIRRGRYRY